MLSFDMIILVGATGNLRSIRFQGYQEVRGDSKLSMHLGTIQSKLKLDQETWLCWANLVEKKSNLATFRTISVILRTGPVIFMTNPVKYLVLKTVLRVTKVAAVP